MAKKKQDLHLDNIEKGLSTLKGIGEAMGETLKTQDVLIDTIDSKVTACPTSSMLAFLHIWPLFWHLYCDHLLQCEPLMSVAGMCMPV